MNGDDIAKKSREKTLKRSNKNETRTTSTYENDTIFNPKP